MAESFEKASAGAKRPAETKEHRHESVAGFALGIVGDHLKRSADIVGIQSRILLTRFGLAVPKAQVGFSKLGARGFFVDDALERADRTLKKSMFDEPDPRKEVQKNELFHRGNEAGFYHIGLDTTHARTAYYETVRQAWHRNVGELLSTVHGQEFGGKFEALYEEGIGMLGELPPSAVAYRERAEAALSRGRDAMRELRASYVPSEEDPVGSLMSAFDYLKRVDRIVADTGLALIEANRFAPKKFANGERAAYKEVMEKFRPYAQEFRKSSKDFTARESVIQLGTTAATLINSGRELMIAEKNLLEMRDARKDLREGRERIIKDVKTIEAMRSPGRVVLTDTLEDGGEDEIPGEERAEPPRPPIQ